MTSPTPSPLVAVTGAAGHVGANLVRTLCDQGTRVRALLLSPEEAAVLDGLDVELVVGDVRDPDAMRDFVAGADLVYHLAAVISIVGDPTGVVEQTNVQGTACVAKAARLAGVRRFVHCSSIHAFRLSLGGLITEQSPRSDDAGAAAYDGSKWRGEQALQREIAEGLDAVIVNPTGILGPHDFGPSRMGKVLDALLRRRMPAVIPGSFNWVDVRDVVDGLIAAGERGTTGENYILSGHPAGVTEIATVLSDAFGTPVPRLSVPFPVVRAIAPLSELFGRLLSTEPLLSSESLDALSCGVTIEGTSARDRLGLPAARPFDTTVRDAAAWHLAQRNPPA